MASEAHERLIPTSPDVTIETRYIPGTPSKLAFVGHPLGRLGGSMNDHVVQNVARVLRCDFDYSVVLINSRGVGKSTGSPSFSGIPEAEDYQLVVDDYVGRVVASGTSALRMATQREAAEAGAPELNPLDILLCGYSAGSLAASYCTPTHLQELINRRCRPTPPPPMRQDNDGGGKPKTIKLRYLLISYPVSVLWALTLFRSSTFTTRLDALIELAGRTSSPSQSTPPSSLSEKEEQDSFPPSVSVSVWVMSARGRRDQFTGDSKYIAWEDRLKSLIVSDSKASRQEESSSNSSVSGTKAARFILVDDADHFWRGKAVLSRLLDEVREWLREE